MPSRSARTRERILTESLRLFNEHGEANVTTGHIADELGISPGNLYYHFRNKDEIIQHLFSDFEKAIDVAPAQFSDAGHAMEDLWLYLHMMFERIWQYRFLYRNLDDLLNREMKWKSHFNLIVTHKRTETVALCHALVEQGAMRASEEEIAALTENILVIASYWLNYENLRLRAGVAADQEQHFARGVYQVMALIAPYLHGDARKHLDHLMKNYTA